MTTLEVAPTDSQRIYVSAYRGEGAARTVSIFASTDIPGRTNVPSAESASSTIFTGTRCTTLVKLPVALSGGSSANSWPLAGARLSTWP